MSFDLYFCWPRSGRINFEEVKAWSEAIECFTRNDAQLWYSDPKTGVYFSFDFEAEAPKSPEDGPDIPEGYFDTGLSFNLNYNRPSYFAFEAMPIVEGLASEFALSVVNPQGNFDEPELATVADSEPLTRSWLHNNERAIVTMTEQPNFPMPLSMSAAASLYLWRYGRAKQDLERTCGEGVFVPSLVPVRRKGDAKAGRATVYTEALPTIVPECEWVFIVRRKNEVATLGVETFRQILAGYIRPFQWQGPDVQIISPELAKNAGKIISAVDDTLRRSEFEVIGTDSFVDIELP